MQTNTKKIKGFDGLLVVAFESRLAVEMSRLITHHGGRPLIAPSMREIPLDQNREALEFGEGLLKGEYDILILLTGVGTRTLVDTLQTRHPRERILEALAGIVRVCRGPKPVAALRSMGIEPGITVPEPNTWQELLRTIDEKAPARGRRMAVQEYGISNLELIQGLKERGATVTRVPVYRWTLPENVEPLKDALRQTAAGRVDVALFTNANQVENIMRVSRDEGLAEKVRSGLARAVIGSVGPISTQSLRDNGIDVDLEPPHPKMGPLVREASLQCHDILKSKRGGGTGADPARGGGPPSAGPPRRAGGGGSEVRQAGAAGAEPAAPWAAEPPAVAPTDQDRLSRSPFMLACRRQSTSVIPIWLMRQAGRYMREYRQIRARRPFLEFCKDPDLVTQVTVYAVERLKVDAAIIFADILLPVEGMGLDLAYSKGDGPKIGPPLRTGEDVDRLRVTPIEEAVGFVFQAIHSTRRALPAGVPLLGFAGAPFTMASYMIEGGASSHYVQTKSFLYRDPGAWNALLGKIADVTIEYLNAQIAAGAQAVQIFDTWVGCLAEADYRRLVLPHTQRVIRSLTPGVPVIHFGTQTAHLLPAIRESGAQVIGLDWRVDLGETWRVLGEVAVQGNLDPTVLFAPRAQVCERARSLLARVGGRPGHIFNLGHGILPHTPLDNVLALVDAVHEWEGAE